MAVDNVINSISSDMNGKTVTPGSIQSDWSYLCQNAKVQDNSGNTFDLALCTRLTDGSNTQAWMRIKAGTTILLAMEYGKNDASVTTQLKVDVYGKTNKGIPQFLGQLTLTAAPSTDTKLDFKYTVPQSLDAQGVDMVCALVNQAVAGPVTAKIIGRMI